MSPMLRKQVLIAFGLLVLTFVTRGSHIGSGAMLPDATLAAMLLGGLLLRRGTWFAAFMSACVAIDAYAVGIAGVSSYCLTPAYWALIPTYGVMWMGGVWLAKRTSAFDPAPFAIVSLVTTSIAFVISTHSFYLFSGRFPEASVWQVLQHGWEYFPAYLGYTMMYLGAAWAIERAAMTIAATRATRNA